MSATKQLLRIAAAAVCLAATATLAAAAAPRIAATTCQMAKAAGYACESHTVATADGYLLNMHRLPPRPGTTSRGPVLLMHGFLGASDNWLLAGPENSLGYLLADDGFDVYLGNWRGNFYSRKHKKLSPADPAFWKFSWQEMGKYDLPAMLDMAQQVSRWPSPPLLVGHSMAAAALSVMLSTPPPMPAPNAHVRAAVLLAPAVFLAPSKKPVGRLLHTAPEYFASLAERNHIYELFPRSTTMSGLLNGLCSHGTVTHTICIDIFSELTGWDLPQLPHKQMSFLLTHIISGASINTALHFIQNHNADQFLALDLGPKENMERYNQTTPPAFDMRMYSQTPVALFYSDNDDIIKYKETKRLYDHIPRKIGMFRVPYEKFTHLDFLIAKDVRRLVYDHVIEILRKY